MIDVIVALFLFCFFIVFAIGLPLALIYFSWLILCTAKDEYKSAENKAEKIYALCTPFFYVVPFIYYNYINDSLWQAALSFFITPIVIILAIGLIWGEENDIFDDETAKVAPPTTVTQLNKMASSIKMYDLPPLCSISSFVLAFMYYFAFRDSLAEAVLLFCVVQLIMIGIWGKRLVKK
ncbi:hypothetical protein ACIRXL_12075 [Avibacterium paragallinarum]|uniref:hypothetical protein n=1 Tax=Avibacterium paragallinarum TaxID=728 RepID=UPI00397A8BCD